MRLFQDMLYIIQNVKTMGVPMKRFLFFFALFCFLFLAVNPGHARSEVPAVPPSLKPWEPWVLYGHEERLCPTPYDNGALHQCAWPSRLRIEITPTGARFSQQWLLFKGEYVPLPGGRDTWPQDVRTEKTPRPVIERNGKPIVWLSSGAHTITGRIVWRKIPEMLPVPPECGLIDLTVLGQKAFPVLDARGRLWLQKKPRALAVEDKLEISAFRLVEDTIPMRVTTLLRLNVSGHPREITLTGVLLENAIPLDLKSPLPARLNAKGQLRLQSRPGQWKIRVSSYIRGHVRALRPTPFIGQREIWSFKPHNDIRMVKIKGAPSIDPRQTELPAEWKRYSAYLVTPGTTLVFEELRRGDPNPAPDQLSLQRAFWLDFDGKGFTIQDHITGTIRRSWRLDMNPPTRLGHVVIDGKDWLITRLKGSKKEGVELRKGRLRLTSESRLETPTGPIPAVGWNHDFQSVRGVLHLPPGWRLLAMSGPDTVTGTWFEQWILLDLFIVLIIAMAVGRLFGIQWGVLAFVTLALIYHEKGAPQMTWLAVLIPVALLRFLPNGWLKRLVRLWHLIAVVVLIVIALPFMVQQVRIGFYPQLERVTSRRGIMNVPAPAMIGARQRAVKRTFVGKRKIPPKARLLSYSRSDTAQSTAYSLGEKEQRAVLAYDPHAKVQTGPGVPTWTWRGIPLKWNGPVDRTQTLRLWLLSPRVNLGLALLRVLLVGWLLYLCAGLGNLRKVHSLKGLWFMGLLVTLLLAPRASTATVPAGAGFPPDTLLNELQRRLLKPPKCLPQCATNPRMDLTITRSHLRILLEIHAAAEISVPLPGNLRVWQPTQVFLDQKPATGLSRDSSGHLWLYCPPGIHHVLITGSVSNFQTFQLPFILMPHSPTITAEGWQVQGLAENGQILSALRFVRKGTKKSPSRQPADSRVGIPPFFHAIRTLQLGLQWSVRTTVERLTPLGSPCVIQLPLLDGESVTTEGLGVQNEKITLSFKGSTRSLHWRSRLDPSERLVLKAPRNVPWTETWVLDVSPVWHCEITGIPVLHHQDTRGYWQPTWKPWPGESVTIRVTRPPAIAGKTLTLTRVETRLDKGKRFDRISLSIDAKASQGQQYTLKLPPRAKLQKVTLDGKSQPIQLKEGRLPLPLHPGTQTLHITWLQPVQDSFTTRLPKIDIAKGAVNASITYKIPPQRWILWAHGPTLGPAVLFWSYLVVILLFAVGLGKISWTPLKTRHWILLGLGLTQVHPLVSLIIVGWLLALGMRKKSPDTEGAFQFDVIQLLLIAWTIAALVGLYLAITKGLLGIPEMQISGNGSSEGWLRWFQDRTAPTLPRPWVLTVPLIVYRGLMLLWALWLAFSLIRWLRWGWHCFNTGGAWKKIVVRPNRKLKIKTPPSPKEPRD